MRSQQPRGLFPPCRLHRKLQRARGGHCAFLFWRIVPGDYMERRRRTTTSTIGLSWGKLQEKCADADCLGRNVLHCGSSSFFQKKFLIGFERHCVVNFVKVVLSILYGFMYFFAKKLTRVACICDNCKILLTVYLRLVGKFNMARLQQPPFFSSCLIKPCNFLKFIKESEKKIPSYVLKKQHLNTGLN